MKKINVTINNEIVEATLIKEEPRIALCEGRIVLLNSHDKIIHHRDLIGMFTTTEITDAKFSEIYNSSSVDRVNPKVYFGKLF